MSRAVQNRLRLWRSIDDFAAELEGVQADYGDLTIATPSLGFYRDAWVGLRCARATGAVRLRLGADPPDIELGYQDGRQLPLEVVEALRTGRRRGDEIRQHRAKAAAGVSTLRHVPGESWPAAAEVLEALSQRAATKAEKGYPPDTVLAIYLNVGDWDNERSHIEAGMAAALEVATSVFADVWVLWHGRFYRTDQAGRVHLLQGCGS